MTAHVVYAAIDPERPATQSPAVVRLIREEIGFDGLLLTDDLSMKALAGSFAERAARALGGRLRHGRCTATATRRRWRRSPTAVRRWAGAAAARAAAALALRRGAAATSAALDAELADLGGLARA